MVFNDTTDNLGICQEIDALCDSDTTSYPVSAKTRRVNAADEEVVGMILNADGVWQFDDDNYTTLPEGTTTLVAGQSDYSFSDTFLDIEWVKVKDSNGSWHILTPIDQSQTNIPLEDYLVTNGMPVWYDKVGNAIRLYPAPASSVVTLTAGMKVGFKRTASVFTAADTTKEPGFASPYHVILAYMASIPYCMTYKKDRVEGYMKKVAELKNEIINHYSSREKDKRKVMTTKPISFR